MNASTDPFLQIKLNYVQMNPAMKQVADYLLAQPPEIGGLTIGELAQKSNVSNATITRFVQTLGFENYKAFQHSIQQFLIEKRINPNATAPTHALLYAGGIPNTQDAQSICQYVIGSEIEMLKDTLSLIKFDVIEQVATDIIEARHVIFIGEGRSYLAAQSACSRFYRMGILCNCYEDYHNMMPAVCMAESDDLIIGISNMGRSAPVTECVQHAREKGLKTVAITSVKGSPLDLAADMTIMTGFNYGNFANKNQVTCYEPGSENLPQFSIIDCLYLMCVTKREKSYMDRYYQAAKLIAEKRL